MKTRNQIVNPRQQPGRRNYHHERERYDRDEMENRSEGGDYFDEVSYGMPNGYNNRDYSNSNYNFWPQQDEPQYSNTYTPSSDYGYERDEYYPMDPARNSPHYGQATGYGNDLSVQGRDFERWAHQNNNDWRREPMTQGNGQFSNNRYDEDRRHSERDAYHRNPDQRYETQARPDHFYTEGRHNHPHYNHNPGNHTGHNSGRIDHNTNRHPGYNGSYRRNNNY